MGKLQTGVHNNVTTRNVLFTSGHTKLISCFWSYKSLKNDQATRLFLFFSGNQSGKKMVHKLPWKLLYRSFVLPHLDYCSVVWNNCGATLTGHMERMQNYALRVILRKPPLTSSELLRRTLGWTTLKARWHNAMLCQVHRCCTNQAPPYLCSKFALNLNLNYVRTRGSNKPHLPRTQTNFYHSS